MKEGSLMFIQGKYFYYGDDISAAFEIRKQVFVIEQGVAAEEEFDSLDDLSVHVLVYALGESQRAVATGRVYYDGQNYRIGRVAVLKDERGKKYGDFVVRMLANKAFLSGAQEVYINAQVTAIPFYEKIGFICFGEEFVEADIKHISMKLISGSLCRDCSSTNDN